MKRYKGLYARTETRVMELTCEAEDEEQASDIFYELINDSESIDFDAMECIDAEDYIQDIEEIK